VNALVCPPTSDRLPAGKGLGFSFAVAASCSSLSQTRQIIPDTQSSL
jgi:hypothetical protein